MRTLYFLFFLPACGGSEITITKPDSAPTVDASAPIEAASPPCGAEPKLLASGVGGKELIASGSHLFWVGGQFSENVFRLDGPNDIKVVATGEMAANSLVVNGDTLYFASYKGLRKVPVAGGKVEEYSDVAASTAMALGGDSIFWTMGSGSVWKSDLATLKQTSQIAPGGGTSSTYTTDLAIAGNILFVASTDSLVWMTTAGANVTPLHAKGVTNVVADANKVYFVDATGALMVASGVTAPKLIGTFEGGRIAQDEGYVYVASTSGVTKIDKKDDTRKTLTSEATSNIAVDSECVYFAQFDLKIIAK